MYIPPKHADPFRVARGLVGAASLFFLGAGFIVDGGGKLFGASAALGTVWWAWDLLAAHFFAPLGDWIEDLTLGGRSLERPPQIALDSRIRILERRLASGGSRSMQLSCAMRLAELYHFQKRNADEARRVIERMKERFPDAPELEKFETALAQRATPKREDDVG